MSDSSEPPPLVSGSEDEDEVSDRSSDSSRFEELTSHQLRNYPLFYDFYRRALKRWTFEWVRLVTDEGGTDGSPRDSGAPLLPAIAEHPRGSEDGGVAAVAAKVEAACNSINAQWGQLRHGGGTTSLVQPPNSHLHEHLHRVMSDYPAIAEHPPGPAPALRDSGAPPSGAPPGRRRRRWSWRRKRRTRGGKGVLCARHARCAESLARATSSTPQRRTITTACQVWTSMSGPRRKRGVAAVAVPRARAGAGRHACISVHVCGVALVGKRNRPRAHASRVCEAQGISEWTEALLRDGVVARADDVAD